MWSALGTALFALGSAVIPILNIEVYLGVIGSTTTVDLPRAVLLATMAALGQTVGKLIWYYAAQGLVNTPWARRKLEKPKLRASHDRWAARVQDNPVVAVVVMFASSFLGFPPLLLTAVVAGTVRMPLLHFIATCFVGRALRFLLLLLGADWIASGH